MEKTGYTQLTPEERYQIYGLKQAGFSPAQIARQLGRARCTIGRELRRNSGQRGYRPTQAQRQALQRRQERATAPRQNTITEATWQQVEQKLQEEWSPAQISGWLHRQQEQSAGQSAGQSVSHERIYQHIYADKKAGGTLHCHLRCQKKRRKRYGSGRQRRGQIPRQRRISERPAVVQERARLGDWEVDTIIGKGQRGVLVSLTERKSRLTLLKKVDAKSALDVGAAVIELLRAVPQNPQNPQNPAVRTITADNGKEFAGHEAIAAALKAEFFFAHPYASWERGSNENANGLVRQYFPKACDFATLTAEQVEHVMQRLNNRPRKTLDFQTPNQVFYERPEPQPVALTT